MQIIELVLLFTHIHSLCMLYLASPLGPNCFIWITW